MIEAPPIAELLPHAPPMMLLERLLDAGPGYIACEVVVRSDGLFDHDGQVPAWLGLEYMAQTIAAFSGWQARARGNAARLGFLLGTRNFETNVANFSCGSVLRVQAERLVQDSSGMAAFQCQLNSEPGGAKAVSQRARLSVFEPKDGAQFLQGARA